MSQQYGQLYEELTKLEEIANNLLLNPPAKIPVEAKVLDNKFAAVVQRFFSQRNWEEVENFNEVLEEIHNRLSIQGDDSASVVEEVMQLVDDLIDTAHTGGYNT